MGPPSQRPSLQQGCQDFCVAAAVKCTAERGKSVGRERENVRTVTQSSRRSCFQIPLMFASALEGRSSRQLQADRRGPAPGCRGTRHNEGCQRCGFPPIRAPAHLPVNPPHHSRLRGAECGSLCTFGHLSCRMAAVSGIQGHLAPPRP